jgi:hypothetical protein
MYKIISALSNTVGKIFIMYPLNSFTNPSKTKGKQKNLADVYTNLDN